jgi:hypothetical protein
MSSWGFVNNANIPIHIGLFNAGILYHFQNNVQPFSAASCESLQGALEADQWPGITLLKDANGNTLVPSTVQDKGCAANFDVAWVGWDIAIIYAIPGSEYDFSQNWSRITEYVGLTLGTILTVAGVALLWVPGAGAALTAGGIAISAGAIATTATGTTIAGIVLLAGDIAVSIAQTVMTPAKFISWYGAHDYMCTVTGGFKYDKPDKDGKVIITGSDPLKIVWQNTDNGQTGTAEAQF